MPVIHDRNIYFDQQIELEQNDVNYFYLSIFAIVFLCIVLIHPASFSAARWDASLDLNHDSHITVSDIWLWLIWIMTLPGDALLQCILASKSLARFFELTERSFGGVASVTFSLCYWWLLGGRRWLVFWGGVLALTIINRFVV